uniref:Rho GTPase-activating protein 18 n=1 Tax=Hirondellea gigas TaxID=1518452 RepID=A0A6A7FY45_9CRUS
MDGLPSVEMQDYWNEVRTIRGDRKESTEEDRSQDEIEEGEVDTAFFESLGLPIDSTREQIGEDDTYSKFLGTLTPRQEEALKRRIQTMNATLRQKRHRAKPTKPDIRSFFSSIDSSSTGTRSRSATPDSLDSASPPQTPPDLNPKTWVDPYLSRSQGSLDSGNHSMITIPCYHPSSSASQVTTMSSYQPSSSSHVTVTNISPPYRERATSIINISSYSNGSTSPISCDSNDGSTPPDRYTSNNNTSKYSSNAQLKPTGTNYNFSRTYISQNSDDSNDYSNHTVTLVNSNLRDNRYTSDSELNLSKKYSQANYRIYPKSDNGESNAGLTDDEGIRGLRTQTSREDTDTSLEEEQPSRRRTTKHRYVHYPEGRVTGLPLPSSLDASIKDSRDAPHSKGIRRQRSYARDIAKDVKFHNNRGVYEFKPQSYHSDDHVRDVQVLRYQAIGSLHIPRNRDTRAPLSTQYAPTRKENQEELRNSEDSSNNRSSQRAGRAESPPTESLVSVDRTTTTTTTTTTRPRSASTTDFGFKAIYSGDGDKFPELVLEEGRSGQTRMDWLHQTDLLKLKNLALLELEIIFTDHNVNHSWRNVKNKKRKEGEKGVFGISLSGLLERDATHLQEPSFTSVPKIFLKLVSRLEQQGLQEEGILRIPGNSCKTEALKNALDRHFYSSPALADEAMARAAPNELVAVLKVFLRMLPEPLLTRAYMPAFHKAHRIEPPEERVVALTMLLLLLPIPHRDTLQVLLELCGRVIEQEAQNRMGLFNVATIMAPNLFSPKYDAGAAKSKLKKEDTEQMLEYARCSCELSQMLIKYRDVLWTVPHRLMGQIRRQYQATGHTAISRLLTRKHKEAPVLSEAEHDAQNCAVLVQSPQFYQQQRTVHLTYSLTARQLLTTMLEEEIERSTGSSNSSHRVEGRREQQSTPRITVNGRPGSRVPRAPPTTCLLRGRKHALLTHSLHERGGNIGERRLDDSARLLEVYQDNPTAEFIVKCRHTGGYSGY